MGADPTQTLVWDAEGELASVTDGSSSDTYTYTADGDRLVRRQGGSTTVYLPGGQELTLTGGTVKATRYYSFGGQVVAVRTGPGTAGASTLVADHHGTAGLSIDNTTRAVTRRYTDPYGNPRGTAPTTWAGDHGFLDKPVDASGLLAVGARYYDPALARFISVDPVMDLADPQQWHGYAYANNNPVTWSDPTGLAPQHDGGRPTATWYTPGYTPAMRGVKPPVAQRPAGIFSALPETMRREPTRAASAAEIEAFHATPSRTRTVWDWVYDNRGTVVTALATAGCFVPGVGQAGCGLMQAGAFAVRTEQTTAAYGGFTPEAGEVIAVDAAMTLVGIRGFGGGQIGNLVDDASDLADDTVIVIGGTKPVPAAGEHFSAMQGRTLDEAAAGVPHNQVQWTTAGDIRGGGGTVRAQPELNTRVGATNYQHVDVCLGTGSCNWRGPVPNPVSSGARFGKPDYPFYGGYLGWRPND